MKTILVLLFCFVLPLRAADVTLKIDAFPEEAQVWAYPFYERVNGQWVKIGEAAHAPVDGVIRFVVSNVTPGVHEYCFSARNVWGEGEKSDSVKTPPDVPHKPGAPPRYGMTIESSIDLLTWQFAAAVEVPAEDARTFYRLAFAA